MIPKSIPTNRIEENIAAFDFTLNDEEMQKISTLETGHTEIIDHCDWHIAEFLNTVQGRD